MVQFNHPVSTPGIPQVYYVGLLAGENDIELLEKMKNGRFIYRHNFTLDEIKEAKKAGRRTSVVVDAVQVIISPI